MLPTLMYFCNCTKTRTHHEPTNIANAVQTFKSTRRRDFINMVLAPTRINITSTFCKAI